jgi:hypothetical protein
MTALGLTLQLLILGLHVVVPWRVAGLPQGTAAAGATGAAQVAAIALARRRLWALIATPLLLVAAIAGLLTLGERIDAAISWGLTWPPVSLPAIALAFAAAAVALTDLLLLAGFRKLEPAGWRIAAGLGVLLLLAASVAGELLRLGRGPAAGLSGLMVAVLCRVLLALAAGQAASGPVRGWATLAGAALPLTLLGSATPVVAKLGADLLTLGAAALLLVAARFLPLSLRRPAVVAGVLLAALFLDRASDLSAALEPASTIPDLFLPEP